MAESTNPAPRRGWLTGWLRRLADASDKQFGGKPPSCCGGDDGQRPAAVPRPAGERSD